MMSDITQYSFDDLRRSKLGLHVGNGKILFAVGVEHIKYNRRGVGRCVGTEILYFGAKSIEDLRLELFRGALTFLPKDSRIVNVSPAIGLWHDEQGTELVA
jgi:hypothetical protein